MASNVIVERVFAFMKHYPPFSFIPAEVLKKLSAEVVIRFLPQGEVLFKEGDKPHDFIYLLKEGSIHLEQIRNDQPELIDICDDGDVFGVRAMLAQKPYIASASASEESLVYAIPIAKFLPILNSQAEVSMFFAAGFASGQPIVRNDISKSNKTRIALSRPENGISSLYELQFVSQKRALISTDPEKTIAEVAQTMTDASIGSIIITDDQKMPIGIVTQSDFKKKVATGIHSIKAPISEIMMYPVKCVSNRHTVADILIQMLKHKVRHLCVTEDGTDKSKAVGIISERDLMLLQGNNPAVLFKQAKVAGSIAEMLNIRNKTEKLISDYLDQEVSIQFIAEIATEINDAIIRNLIERAEDELANEEGWVPDEQYCWLSLGSEGRGEQLLRTDQDNALVYEDSPNAPEKVHDWFIKLAEKVNTGLEGIGFVKCPADIMARNPKWCQPMSKWKQYFRDWIEVPEPQRLMHASIFFDFRAVYGEEKLAGDLRTYIYEMSEKSRGYLNHLANNAIQNPPPLSFFRNFLVEKGGEHKDEFDIKARGMMPLADAARLLSLRDKLNVDPNTVKRFEALAKKHKKRGRLFRESAMAYGILMRFRAKEGLKKGNSGRYISPDAFNKIERQTLRNAFKTIEELQDHLKSEFQLQFFR